MGLTIRIIMKYSIALILFVLCINPVMVSGKDSPKEKRPNTYSEVSFRGGFLIIFGRIGGKTTFFLPYVGVSLKDTVYKSKTVFWEVEIGYFAYKSKDSFLQSNTVHAVPVTVSLFPKLKLSNGFYLYPKLGIGFITTYTSSTVRSSGFSALMVLKPALEIDIHLSKSWSLLLGGSLYVAQDVNESDLIKNLDYFLIPTVGLSHRF